MLHTSYIELDADAFRHNLHYLRQQVDRGARYSMVIKGNAYGHGIETIIPLAEENDVDHFSVFSVAEAIRAKKAASRHCDIMIMGWIESEEIAWAIENDISFYVFTFHRLNEAIKHARELKRKARIHLEMETGMHRTGFQKNDMERLFRVIERNGKYLEIEGICTHYAGAESINNYGRIREQISVFNNLIRDARNKGVVPKYRHTACSAALLRYPETIMDLVRVGIANYGFWPSDELRMNHFMESERNGVPPADPLRRVLSWKSTVMSVNTVASGEYVSYGRSFLTNRETRIATVPVGYGYGYARTLSNMGHVLLHGKRVRVIGSVNMNMLVVDATDTGKTRVGDEVVLIGSQGDMNISVSSFGDMTNSLNYELLTRLPSHIPRTVIRNGS